MDSWLRLARATMHIGMLCIAMPCVHNFVQMCGVQVLWGAEEMLRQRPDFLTDAHAFALMCELRASGSGQAPPATDWLSIMYRDAYMAGSATSGSQPAKEVAVAEDKKQKQWQAVGQRVARYLASLPADQRIAALARLGAAAGAPAQ